MKIGSKVSVLDEAITGFITKIEGELITVSSQDGFEMQFPKNELVVENFFSEKNLDLDNISAIIAEKEEKVVQKSVVVKRKERISPPMEVDLHIHQLVKYTKGMSNFDMLTIQIDTAKRQLDFAIQKRIQKVVFIHGVGEGVLRAELEYLFRRYEHLKYYDANYQKYGKGAVEVYIFQNKKG